MKLLKHILSALILLMTISANAGISPTKADSPFYMFGNMQEENIVIDKSNMGNIHFSTNDITNPLEREAMRMKMMNNMSNKFSSCNRINENDEQYTVKCVFKGVNMPDLSIYNANYFDYSKLNVWFESNEKDTYYFQVPAGTYDICASYYSDVAGMEGYAYIIHENVEIDSDT